MLPKLELGTIELKRLAGHLIRRTLYLKATLNKRFVITQVKRKCCLQNPIRGLSVIFEIDGLRCIGLHQRLRLSSQGFASVDQGT